MLHLTANVLPSEGIDLKPLTAVTGYNYYVRAGLVGRALLSLRTGRLQSPIIRASAGPPSQPNAWRVPPRHSLPCSPLDLVVEVVDVPEIPDPEEARKACLALNNSHNAASIFETLTGRRWREAFTPTPAELHNILLATVAARLLSDQNPSVLVVPDAFFGARNVQDGYSRMVAYLCGVACDVVTVVAGMPDSDRVDKAVDRGDLDPEDLTKWYKEP